MMIYCFPSAKQRLQLLQCAALSGTDCPGCHFKLLADLLACIASEEMK